MFNKSHLEKPGGSSGHTIIDENGNPMTARANLEFTGTGVSVTDNDPNTVITITGGGGWGNLDSGFSDSTYGAVSPIDCGASV